MSPITAEEAFNATNPDPQAYGLPSDAPEEQVKARREESARQLMAGVAANDVYWDSRSQLESLVAKAQGHGTVALPPEDPDKPPAVTGGAETEAVEGTVVAGSEETLPAGSTTGGPGPAPAPDNPVEAVAKLRAQLQSAGLTPDA